MSTAPAVWTTETPAMFSCAALAVTGLLLCVFSVSPQIRQQVVNVAVFISEDTLMGTTHHIQVLHGTEYKSVFYARDNVDPLIRKIVSNTKVVERYRAVWQHQNILARELQEFSESLWLRFVEIQGYNSEFETGDYRQSAPVVRYFKPIVVGYILNEAWFNPGSFAMNQGIGAFRGSIGTLSCCIRALTHVLSGLSGSLGALVHRSGCIGSSNALSNSLLNQFCSLLPGALHLSNLRLNRLKGSPSEQNTQPDDDGGEPKRENVRREDTFDVAGLVLFAGCYGGLCYLSYANRRRWLLLLGGLCTLGSLVLLIYLGSRRY